MLSITVNGTIYPLPVQTDDLQERLDELYDAGRLSELVDPHAHLTNVRGDWPTPPVTDWPRPRLGSLYWPVVGLARYAFGCFLIDEYTLGQIRAGMIAADTNECLVGFEDEVTDLSAILLDENGEQLLAEDGDPLYSETPSIVVPMRFLASRPLVRTNDVLLLDSNGEPLVDGNGAPLFVEAAPTTTNNSIDPVDAWVLLLVDDRYATLHEHGTLTYTSWYSLFGSGGVTVGDLPDADYLVPEATRWTDARVTGRSQGWLLDVAAASVGSRIVVVPGESPQLQRPTALRAAALSFAHATLVIDYRFCGGGQIEDADVEPGFPDTAKVVFGGPDEATPVVVTVSGVGYGWPTGTHVTHWSDGKAALTSGQRSALAAQWADDWEAWQRDTYDTTYNGLVPVPASGFLWAVEWYHDGGKAYTKYVRPPHWYGYLLAPSVAPPPPEDDIEWGCGLTETDGTVAVDLTDAVFDGLYWNDEICALGVDFGCGLTIVGSQLAVDYSQLAGDRTVTSLIMQDKASGCDNLMFDNVVASTTTETLSNGSSYSTVGQYMVVTETLTTYTNHFNAAGVHVNRTAGTPYPRVSYVPICSSCCDSTQITVDAFVSHTLGGTELRSAVVLGAELLYFDASGTTGGSGGLTYEWYFDDPLASVYPDTPDATGSTATHLFSAPGYHTVLLVVRDGSECAYARYLIPVFVVEVAPECDCEANCPDGAPYGYTTGFESGTQDFAFLNGIWEIPLSSIVDADVVGDDETCVYSLGVDDKGNAAFQGFSIAVVPVSPGNRLVTVGRDGFGTPVVEYNDSITSCCDTGANNRTPDDFDASLDGTPNNLDGPGVLGDCSCDSDCSEFCTDYQVTGKGNGGLMTRTDCTWTASSTTEFDAWTLSYDGAGAWTLTNTASGWTGTTAAWDGTGCATFTRTSGPDVATEEACCAD